MFRRRNKHNWLHKLRQWLWPKAGWRRAFSYRWHRLKRLPESADAVARGFGIGAAMGITPFLLIHTWLALLISWLLDASLLATLAGTMIGNYIVIVPIFMLEYEIGSFLFEWTGITIPLPAERISFAYLTEHPGDFMTELWHTPQTILPLLLPTTLGSVVLGGVLYIVFSALIRDSVHRWREQRRHVIAAGRRKT